VKPVSAGAGAPGPAFFGHPAGLAALFFTEMWERLSFYGMRALLVLFLVDSVAHGGLGLDDRSASAIYGLYVGATYIAALPGGWIADRLIGSQRAVLVGGGLITCGHVLLWLSTTSAVFFAGLFLIVLGTGLLKPNASALVAQLYPEGGARRDAGFTIYYVGINLGATLGPLIAGLVAQRYGWRCGFLTAALGMAAGVLQFLWGRALLGGAGLRPARAQPGWAGRLALPATALLVLITTLLIASGLLRLPALRLQVFATTAILVVAVGYFAYLLFGAGLDRAARARILALLVLFAASTLFWAGYEQTGSSLNLFAARYTDRHWLGLTLPASAFQSLNPIYIVIFGPLFGILWLRLARRGLDPSTPVKFILGLLGMAGGFLVMAAAARLVAAGHQVGIGWLMATYLLHTWGELALSPVGMSATTRLVPDRLVGQALGLWFVSLSLGNLLASRIAGQFDPAHREAMPGQFMHIVWFGTLCAAGLALSLPLMRRWTQQPGV
jgi:POT family proton-dependent oligopeptide transporter